MLFLTLLVVLLVLYLYSIRCLDAPISPSVRSALTFLRFLFLGSLLLLLTRPLIEDHRSISVAPTLYLAIDDTRSMSYPVMPQATQNQSRQPSRWEVVRRSLVDEKILENWRDEDFQLRFGLFSELSRVEAQSLPWASSYPQSATPDGIYTDIASVIGAFERSASERESSYLLLFTDGQSNRGKNPVAAAASLLTATSTDSNITNQRIYSFGIGSAENVMDIIVDSVQLPANARAVEPLQLTAHVIARGELPNQPVTLQIQGETQDGTVIYNTQQTVHFTTDQAEVSVAVDLPSLEAGDYVFRVEALPLEGELFYENNRQTRGVNVRSSKDRMMLLTSAPDWELKFLKRALENQESVHVDAYFQHENGISQLGDRYWLEAQADTAKVQDASQVATLEELQTKIATYSIVVLHNFRFAPETIDLARQIKNYVENGGALIYIPGALNTVALPPNVQEALPPLIAAGVSVAQMQIMPQGEGGLLSQIPALSSGSLPPLSPYFHSRANNPTAQALLRGKSAANETFDMIQLHRYGLGRILMLSTNSFWRWQMLLGESPLASFWLTVLYQSNPGLSQQQSQLYTNGFLYEVLSPVQVSYAAQGQIASATLTGVSVKVSGPEGEQNLWLTPSDTRPGMYSTTYTPAEAGEYRFADTIGSASAAIRVEANPRETYNIRQNVNGLREIAQRTGGDYANQPAWKALAQNLPKATRTVDQSRIQFLGEKWWIAALLIAFLGLEWFVRWRQGLP